MKSRTHITEVTTLLMSSTWPVVFGKHDDECATDAKCIHAVARTSASSCKFLWDPNIRR